MASLFQSNGLRRNRVDVAFVHHTVGIDVLTAAGGRTGFELSGQGERIEDVHSTIVVQIFASEYGRTETRAVSGKHVGQQQDQRRSNSKPRYQAPPGEIWALGFAQVPARL